MSARVSNQTPPPTSPFGKRPSPIEEEKVSAAELPAVPSSSSPADLPAIISSSSLPTATSTATSTGTTTSTDSTRTVRARDTGKGISARTPSYPFPRMITPGHLPAVPAAAAWSAHKRSQRSLSRTESPSLEPRPEPRRDASSSSFRSDQVLSSPSTPGSAITFLPTSTVGGGVYDNQTTAPDGRGQYNKSSTPEYPSPHLYELSLALSSEPGLDAWWSTVVHIATEWYKAERVALAIPADSTDVQNMPWGQKATFNAHEKDDNLSLGYMGRSSSFGAAATDLASDSTPLHAALSPQTPHHQSLPPAQVSSEPRLRRPSLASRYTYTAFEDRKEQTKPVYSRITFEQPPAEPVRPSLHRCQTSQPLPTQRSDIPKAERPDGMIPAKPYTSLNVAALEEHDAVEEPREAAKITGSSLQPQQEARGRVLPVLQALDYEADPLIDHNGVQRVLDRGSVVALTRSYPYIAPSQTELSKTSSHALHPEDDRESQPEAASASRPTSGMDQQPLKLSTLFGGSGLPSLKSGTGRPSARFMKRLTSTSIASKLEEASPPRSESPLYEEYEQMPPSPWSQSPAPSPAVRHEQGENPFFSDAVVDEDSFNPDLSPDEYKESYPPAAIGFDNAWTVLHIPLYHPLLSKTNQQFRLDKSKMERRSSPKREASKDAEGSPDASPSRPKRMPIAILSILSPIIPYPSNLRHSLEHIAPHMATSLSLCIHYSNLEAEVNGLNRRRHDLGGFGGIDTEGHPLPTPSAFGTAPYSAADDPLHRSHAGSMTSYSDYSTRSRSIAGSPGGTPGWDSLALNMFLERRGNPTSGISPSITSLTGDGYFGMRASALARPVTTPGSSSGGAGGVSVQRGRKSSVTQSSATLSEKRLSSIRLPEVTLPSQGEHSTVSDPTNNPLVPQPAASTNRSDDADRLSASSMTESSASTSAEPAANTSITPTANPVSVPAEPKRKSIEKEPSVSDELKLAMSDRPPLASPMPHTPGGTYHHQRHPRFQHQYSHSHSGHSQLHSYGADFASTFPSLPPSGTIAVKGASASMLPPASAPSRAPSVASSSPVDMPPPSDRLKSLILDSLPAHVFVAMPQTGAIVWVNSRYLAYRGQTVEGLAEDPWGSLHPDDRDEYLKAWSHSVRTGDQFSRTVRIRRFDGSYRWFQARAVASRDRRNSIMQFLGSYMDIHDQHIAELKAARQEEIEASETKHRILANLIPQIIFTANEEEGVTFANEQWLSYTGQKFEDLLGLGFLDNVHPLDLAKCCFIPVPEHLKERRKRLFQSVLSPCAPRPMDPIGERPPRRTVSGHEEDSEEELSELAELARRGIILVTTDDNGRPSYTTEVRLRSKSGDYRWHLVRCVETGTMDFGKGYNSYFGSATDINDHKLLETKLKEAMDSKTRFLSNMSHEIRTPLIGISGMVSFLQDTTLNEEQRDYTNTIQTSANSLLMIINDILDLSKVDAGMMKLSFEWFHTRSLIEDVNELVSTMAIAKGLELNYIVDTDVPSWVKGDRVRMRQVLLNVIGNAIKFTSDGEVFSRCRVINQGAQGENKIELEFSIMDTGRGFTKEEAELIFKPFSQIDGSSTRQHGGSGLGLVISRQLVELHGGKMHGSAVPNKGSTFTFTAVFGLPTESDHPDGLSTPSLESSMAASGGALSAMGYTTPSFVDSAAVVAAAAASAAGANSHPIRRSTMNSVDTLPTAFPTHSSNGSSSKMLSLSDRSSSMSSLSTMSYSRFKEAARHSEQDLSRMVFKVPPGSDRGPLSAESTMGVSSVSSPRSTANPSKPSITASAPFSILIVCPQMHSREATAKHIETTLPKGRPYKIAAVATTAEVLKLIDDGDHELFTHVVVNLPSPKEILELVDQLDRSPIFATAKVLVLSDSVQRQAVNRLAAGTRYEALLSDSRAMYIYKPVKPSRFAVIFDPERESDISIDRNRSSARRLVETEKQSYLDLEQRMGNKGYKVLLVEDNMVNQKVLTKYLHKVGVEVDMAADGVECTDIVLSRPHDYYSLILCDLHMPRKDGYQACREIREWEAADHDGVPPLPIIALSANVMSDVHDKCVDAGFSKYITKPVDFVMLSRVLLEFF